MVLQKNVSSHWKGLDENASNGWIQKSLHLIVEQLYGKKTNF